MPDPPSQRITRQYTVRLAFLGMFVALLSCALALSLANADAPMRPRAFLGEHGCAIIPRGQGILIDGRVEAGEWDDACEIRVAPNYRLLAKYDTAYLYLAIVRSKPTVFGVNLYLASPGSPAYLNLHASAKLGERLGHRRAWPDWVWWNNRAWSANVERFNAFTGERFLPDTAKEFQIALGRLPGTYFRLTFDIETVDGTEQPVVDGPLQDEFHWIALQLAPQ